MVKDSINTCMLWVSGLNSNDMQSANAMSANTKDGKPSMRLVSISDKAMDNMLGLDGANTYGKAEVSPVSPDPKTKNPGFYYNLIDTGFWSTKVELRTVPAWIYAAPAVMDNAKLLNDLTKAVEDASPTIWNTVNPQ
jgi:hypothetical protein